MHLSLVGPEALCDAMGETRLPGGYINPPWKGGASLKHTRSAPEGAITLCAAVALAHGCRMPSPAPLVFRLTLVFRRSKFVAVVAAVAATVVVAAAAVAAVAASAVVVAAAARAGPLARALAARHHCRQAPTPIRSENRNRSPACVRGWSWLTCTRCACA